ncbi:hypothetical protein J1P26_09700 [Neobacillus sp. MM2021_6]|uniref:hypothetical protein n=1 Tax=Bacillaceae TaxID=186817 RepID=UPI00140B164E|nr:MULTISPECIES: hypothetical protein [Bacillaceae]MBO0959997.1 hypothetical protein [Neobacillus sp. MM2021_6]NHC18681.1 hypothetical protein [Bacillus sp. MM2020_4]
MMRKTTDLLLVILGNLLAIGYIVKLIFNLQHQVDLLFAAISILLLLITFYKSGKTFSIIAGIFLGLGFWILISNHISVSEYWRYFGSSTNILTLLIVAPLFSIPIKLGAYHRTVEVIFRNRVYQPNHVHGLLSFFTFALSSLMSMAAIAVSHSIFHNMTRKFPKTISEKIEFSSYARGNALALVWSPVGVTVGAAISGTHSNATLVIGVSLSFALFIILIDYLMVSVLMKKSKEQFAVVSGPSVHPEPISAKHWISIMTVGLVIILFVTATLVLHHFWELTIIDIVIVLIILFSVFWSLFLKKTRKFVSQLKLKMTQGISVLSSQLLLFISVGFFTQVFINVGHLNQLAIMIEKLQHTLGPFIIIIIVLIAASGIQLGLSPALIAVLMVETIPFHVLHIRPEWFAFAVAAGALSLSAASPFSVTVNTVSPVLQRIQTDISKMNYGFSIMMLCMVNIWVLVLQYLFP